MVTNILDESTTLIYSGDVESVVVNAFGKDVKDNAVFLPNTMSRKETNCTSNFRSYEIIKDIDISW